MHVRASLDDAEFLRGLRLAQGIADRKSTMPMLANVLVRTQGENQLVVAATDLDVSLTAELEARHRDDAGRIVGRTVAELCGSGWSSLTCSDAPRPLRVLRFAVGHVLRDQACARSIS